MWIHGTESRKSMGTNFTFFPIFALGLQASIPEKRQDPKIKDACESLSYTVSPCWASSSPGVPKNPEPPKRPVMSRSFPSATSYRRLSAPDLNIEVLVPPGASPETFEPTPKQFVKLQQAPLIFNVGLIDFETTPTRQNPEPRQNRRPEPRNPTHRRDLRPREKQGQIGQRDGSAGARSRS